MTSSSSSCSSITDADAFPSLASSSSPQQQHQQQQLLHRPRSLLVLIRHGHSVENEKMEQPGNRWGDATFCDDIQARDSPLSCQGMQQAQELTALLHHLLSKELLQPPLVAQANDDEDDDEEDHHDDDNGSQGSSASCYYDIQIVSSPLTRSLQTLTIGVLPWLKELQRQQQQYDQPPSSSVSPSSTTTTTTTATTNNNMVTYAKALPLCTERIYTAADLGRPMSQLQHEFPMVDFNTYGPQQRHQVDDHENAITERDERDENDNDAKWWWEMPTTMTTSCPSINDEEHYERHEKESTNYKDHHPSFSKEWRPFGQGQWYAVPGEPWHVFEQRMKQLQRWILQQFQLLPAAPPDDDGDNDMSNSQKIHTTGYSTMQDTSSSCTSAATTTSNTTASHTIISSPTTTTPTSSRPVLLIMITHWGVIRYLTGGQEVKNCQIITVEPEDVLQRYQQPPDALVLGL